jgi:hypothetical protein
MTILEFVAPLADVKETPTGYSARCPNHPPDEYHTLSIRLGDRVQFLARCDGWCRFNEILAAHRALLARKAGVR